MSEIVLERTLTPVEGEFTGHVVPAAQPVVVALPKLEETVRTGIHRMHATAQGVVTGVMFGSGLFLATNFLVLKGGKDVGAHLSLLNQFFPGYQVTFVGSLVGFGYASVLGFLLGSVLATVYNTVSTRIGAR